MRAIDQAGDSRAAGHDRLGSSLEQLSFVADGTPHGCAIRRKCAKRIHGLGRPVPLSRCGVAPLSPSLQAAQRIVTQLEQLCWIPSPQVIGDAMEVVASLPDKTFDRIIHDPPTFALGGALYSTTFYSSLSRILATKGVLYHYTGDPSSTGTARVVKGVVKRLHDVSAALFNRERSSLSVQLSTERVAEPRRCARVFCVHRRASSMSMSMTTATG